MEADHGLDMGRGQRVHAVVGAAELGDDKGDLLELSGYPAQFIGHLGGLVEGDAGRQRHLQPERAFVEIGQEIAADRGAKNDHSGQSDGEGDQRCAGAVQDAGQQVYIAGRSFSSSGL